MTNLDFSSQATLAVRTGEIVVVFDSSLKYLYLNSAACESLNKNENELVGKCITDMYPEVLGSPNENLRLALTGSHIKGVIEGASGEQLDVDYKPIFEDGKVTYLVIKANYVAA